jgi:hypothetical protein
MEFLKLFSFLIWNRDRDLPTCRTMPQPTVLPRGPVLIPLPEMLQPGLVSSTAAKLIIPLMSP